MLKLLSLAVLAFAVLALGAMAAIYVVTSEPPVVRGPARPQDGALAVDPPPAVAPLVVLPPPAPTAAPAPYAPPPGVVIETLAPPPPVPVEPQQHAEQLVAFREVRRASAMDQLNAREALRRQRLGRAAPPPAPASARPLTSARRPGKNPEYATP